ncbi:uncharacterized protein [Branchiostoma lanceolatum]|uniref:uncharacterized protein n=1 Tax=Branchiostoma lanceolatum TaxID=7740 RepID=UPI0034539E5A
MADSHNKKEAVGASETSSNPSSTGGLIQDEDGSALRQGDSGYYSHHLSREDASDTVDAQLDKPASHTAEGKSLPSYRVRKEEEEFLRWAASQASKSPDYVQLEEGVIFSKFIVTSTGKKVEIIRPDGTHYRRGERYSSSAEWVTGGLLGEGAYGKVHLCEDLATSIKKQHAVKETKLREFNPVEANSWLRLGFSRQVCGLNAVILQDGAVWWHMELINPRVSLKQLVEIHQPKPLHWRDAVTIATGVFAAIAHMHSCRVKHCDLHPGNVMLCKDLRVKVIDFSLLQPAVTDDDFSLDIQNGLQLFLHMLTAKSFRFSWTEALVQEHVKDAKVLPLVLKMFQPVTNQTAAELAQEFSACRSVKGVDEADGIKKVL